MALSKWRALFTVMPDVAVFYFYEKWNTSRRPRASGAELISYQFSSLAPT